MLGYRITVRQRILGENMHEAQMQIEAVIRRVESGGLSEEEAMVLIAEITTNIAEPERLSEAVQGIHAGRN